LSQLSNPPSQPTPTPKEAKAILWKKGLLYWKLDANQQQIREIVINAKNKLNVLVCSRQLGKTYALCAIAVEECMKSPNRIVKIIAPEVKMIKQILQPKMREIFQDCPKDLVPQYRNNEHKYVFHNGSEIQLAGTDNGHAESIRGSVAHLCIIDEAGFCSDLDYIVKSILIPTTTTTNGKIILSSTPPKTLDHEFMKFWERAEVSNTLFKRTIYDNPRLSTEQIDQLADAVGGVNSIDFRREYLCVDENTLIKTKKGYKEIKNIEIGDQVFTHKGRYKPVMNVFKNKLDDRDVYKVKSSFQEGHICTEGHELFVAQRIEGEFIESWEEVQNIDPTKDFYFKVPIENVSSESISPDLAYLIGWHIAEGHVGTTQQYSVLSVNGNDPIDLINECSQNIWGKKYVLSTKNGNALQYQLNLKAAREFYTQFGLGAKNKHIPEKYKNLNQEATVKLLEGLFLGDGYVRKTKKGAGLVSISLKLLSDVSDLLLKLGITSGIHCIRKEGPSVILNRDVYCQNCYSLMISGKSFDRFMELIHNKPQKTLATMQQSFIKDGFYYSRIRKIEKIQYNKPYVFDIEVEEDHSYVGVHATFHNCEKLVDAKLCRSSRI
jgi:hypothetical protein